MKWLNIKQPMPVQPSIQNAPNNGPNIDMISKTLWEMLQNYQNIWNQLS